MQNILRIIEMYFTESTIGDIISNFIKSNLRNIFDSFK